MHHAALHVFDSLPLKERLFVRGRLATAPLQALASRVVGQRVLDVGCGHGLLSALIAKERPGSELVGIDPDQRKVAWARASVGTLPRTRFEAVGIDALAEREPGSFDCVVVSDVLYLLGVEAWPGFFRACRTLLGRGGRLLLKEAEDDGSWRAKKALLQEQVMVKLLRRTHGSGGLGFQPRELTSRLLEEAGFEVLEIVPLAKGYSTPHVLFVAQAR